MISLYGCVQCKIDSTHGIGNKIVYGIFKDSLTFTTLWANSADDKWMFFFLTFPRKQSLTFQLYETISRKCQTLFSKKNKKKYFKMSSAEILTQSAKRSLVCTHCWTHEYTPGL